MTIETEGPIFAHSPKEGSTSEGQELPAHLEGVAELAERFCAAFGAAPWGHLAGLWHDQGKYRQAFQEYIRKDRARAEHSIVGALLARDRAKSEADRAWEALAFVIAGHHGGLPNLRAEGPRKPLIDRLDDQQKLLAETLPAVPEDLREHPLPPLPPRLATVPRKRTAQQEYYRTFEFWIRFLFSALVDADFLDTEKFYRGDERALQTAGFDDVATLRVRLDAHVDAKSAVAEPTQVNALRAVQPYVVNVARWQLERLVATHAVELVHDVVFALNTAYGELYDERFGLILEGELFANPESLIV